MRNKIFSTLIFIAIIVVLACMVAGCGNSGPKSVATVNGQKVTQKEFDAALKANKASLALQKAKTPKDLKQQVFNLIIQQRILEQAAAKQNIKVSKKDVDKQVGLIVDNFYKGENADFKKDLTKHGLDEASFETQVKSQLLTQQLREKLTANITVTDAEIAKYYKDNISQFSVPQNRAVSQILIKDPAKAETVRASLTVKNFAATAKKVSEDPTSKSSGGELTVVEGQNIKAFTDAAFSLKTGEISAPIKTSFGYYIILARQATVPAHKQTLVEATPQIKNTLQTNKANEAFATYLAKVRKDANVDVSGDNLTWKATS